MTAILFVYMGNICRSPTAEGAFRHLLAGQRMNDVRIDSAGTHGWHQGAAPDPRATEAARRRGIDISGQKARRLVSGDFETFDYILAMDRRNLADMERLRPPLSPAQSGLFLKFASGIDTDEVPDPYQGGDKGFELVLDLIENASKGLLAYLRALS